MLDQRKPPQGNAATADGGADHLVVLTEADCAARPQTRQIIGLEPAYPVNLDAALNNRFLAQEHLTLQVRRLVQGGRMPGDQGRCAHGQDAIMCQPHGASWCGPGWVVANLNMGGEAFELGWLVALLDAHACRIRLQ